MNKIKIDKKSSVKKIIDKTINTYTPVIAESHTPPYKIHKYFARRPWNVFEQIITNFSNEGDIILDPFCGGGVTIYEGIRKNRKVIGCDLNPLSIFIVNNMVKKVINDEIFDEKINHITNYIKFLYKNYETFKIEDGTYKTEWCELTFKVICNVCKKETLLSNEYKKKNGSFICNNISCKSHSTDKKTIESKNCERIGHEYLYLCSNEQKGKKVIKSIDIKEKNRIKKHIEFLNEQIINEKIKIPQDKIPLDWDRQFEDGLFKKGIKNFQDFFTERNLLILLLLKNEISKTKEIVTKDQYELLRIIFSNTIKDTNIMSFTNDTWQGGNPTTWSKHAYWVPSQFCEVDILPSFLKSVQRVVSSINYNNLQDYQVNKGEVFNDISKKNLLLYNLPIHRTDIKDNSVNVIITDPPYGSNVQYLELSHFWYVWNLDLYKEYPDFKQEAISNRKKGFKGAKSMYDYENNLFKVFEKSYNVLIPNGYMILTFNNKDVTAWLSLLFSIFKSGFTLEIGNIYFQDGVKNYKQTSHTKSKGSPYGDFIYSFQKKKTSNNIKSYSSEESFYKDIDGLFKSYLNKDLVSKNDLILEMFEKSIPMIEGFSKSYLSKNNHTLYSKFNKEYFNQFFNND